MLYDVIGKTPEQTFKRVYMGNNPTEVRILAETEFEMDGIEINADDIEVSETDILKLKIKEDQIYNDSEILDVIEIYETNFHKRLIETDKNPHHIDFYI